jgi:glycosyltransferase involved in cell wall biosynthesis
MGYVTSLELLAQIYAACDLFVSTSLAENFPMCVVEAMASGIAVVAFDVGGICEQICQATGVLVPARDLQGMVRAIESLAAVESQGRVTDMGRAARAKCEASFSVDKVMAGYLALYAELLDAAPAVRRLAA